MTTQNMVHLHIAAV